MHPSVGHKQEVPEVAAKHLPSTKFLSQICISRNSRNFETYFAFYNIHTSSGFIHAAVSVISKEPSGSSVHTPICKQSMQTFVPFPRV